MTLLIAGHVSLLNKLTIRIRSNTGPARDCGVFCFGLFSRNEIEQKKFEKLCIKTELLNVTKQIKDLRKQLRHTRFTMLNAVLSLTACYSFVQSDRTIEPIGSVKNILERPGYANT